MSADPTPVTDLADREVYTADAVRVGRVVDVVVDLLEGTPVALAVADVSEDALGGPPDGAAGLRVPMSSVRGVGDAVVLRVTAREAALPLPGGPGTGGGAGPDPPDRAAADERTRGGAEGGTGTRDAHDAPGGTADGGTAGGPDAVRPVDGPPRPAPVADDEREPNDGDPIV